MELIHDGNYLLAKQDDGNLVVYDSGVAVWDKWSYEANRGGIGLPVISNPITDPIITPNNPSNPPLVSTPELVASGCNPIGMSYWRNINQHKNDGFLRLFLSIHDELTLFTIDKYNLEVINSRSLHIHHTGEGCYFSAIDPEILFVTIDNRLVKVNVNNGSIQPIWSLDDGNNLWQCHSSYDDSVHSGTIKNRNYNIIKWGVSINGQTRYFDLKGEPDECQIDASGQFLVIKEDNYNRIIHLVNGSETIITNEQGAVGHSDCGFGVLLGENDMSSQAGACDLIDLASLNHRNMFSTGIWNMGYVSFTNAKSNLQLEEQKCLITTPLELISVKLDGSGVGTKICSNLTQDQSYENRPKANLCPEGEFAAWTALVNGSLNAYIVRL